MRRTFSAFFAIAVTASAQCYQFTGAGATLQINITSFVSVNPVTTSVGYNTVDSFVSSNSLTIGSTTLTSVSTPNLPACVGCTLGAANFGYANGLSDFTMLVPANTWSLQSNDSWGVMLGGVGNLIPSGVLPQPAAFPPASSWMLPGATPGLGYDYVATTIGNVQTFYPITATGACAASTGGSGSGTTGNGTCAITSVNTTGAPSSAGIAQNSWTEIHGTCLVPNTTTAAGVVWNTAPSFLQGQMPTLLNGVSVTVNGKPAYIYFFCSATTDPSCANDQINVLTPLDPTTGNVQIVVTSSVGTVAPYSATLRPVAPSFLLFSAHGYIAATDVNYNLIGPATLQGPFTPAAPGETIVTFATGFGLPTSALTAGSELQSGVLPATPVCTIGGLPAPVGYAGITSPGLYQLNIAVPLNAAAGDNPISCSYGGSSTPVGDLVTVN